LLQSLTVSCTQLGRTVLQQDQAMSTHRDPIRQARRQLPRLYKARIHPIWLRAYEFTPFNWSGPTIALFAAIYISFFAR
jgi:hypothetical protein